MIRIATLDDETQWLTTERIITEQCFESGDYSFSAYNDVDKFLLELKYKENDLYLLDMEFPLENGISGLSIGREIKDLYPSAVIIYVTCHAEYAIEAFEVNAFRYIPKILLEKKLPEAYKVLEPEIGHRKEEYFEVVTEKRMERIAKSQIYYMYKEKKYVVLIHSKGECKIRTSLGEIQERLNQDCFLRIDKGCVVNIKHIMSVEPYQVKMRTGVCLTVSHPQLKNVKDKIAEYWRKRN